jgi:hypothetical protein
MLNKEVCHQCKSRYVYLFFKYWKMGFVHCACAMVGHGYYNLDVKHDEPPKECPYVLEHLVASKRPC